MKTIIISIAIAFLSSIYINCQKIEVTPLSMNFNGIITSGHNIIAYSDNGQYLMTTDRGKSWGQYKLVNNGNITLMINYNDTLYALVDRGVFAVSDNHGLTWEKYSIDLEEKDSLFYFAVNSSYLYLRSKMKIIKYNKNIELLKELQDSLLICNKPFNTSYNSIEYHFQYIGFDNEYLMVSVMNNPYDNHGQIWALNEDLELIKKLDLISLMTNNNIASLPSMTGFELNKIFQYQGKSVFLINSQLCYADNDYKDWKLIFKNDSVGHNYPEVQKGYWNEEETKTIIDNKIFLGRTKKNESVKRIIAKDPGGGLISLHDLGVGIYNEALDSFQLYGNYFDNHYHTSGFMKDDGISSSDNVKHFTVMEDSIIVWAGRNKTLIQSTDYGNTWKLLSYYNKFAKPSQIVNDSVAAFCLSYPYQKYSTMMSGILIQPLSVDTLKYKSYFLDLILPSLEFTRGDGKGFFFSIKLGNCTTNNIAYTEDFGRSYKFSSTDTIWGDELYHSTISNADYYKKIYFAVNRDFLMYQNQFPISRIVSVDLDKEAIMPIDSLYYTKILHISVKDEDNIILYTNSFREKLGLEDRFEILKTSNGCKTWDTVTYFDKTLNIKQIYEHNKDSVFISAINPNIIYLFEPLKNSFIEIYKNSDTAFTTLKLMVISDHFYIISPEVFLENADRSDLTKWKSAGWEYGKPKFQDVLFKGNIAFALIQDSIHSNGYYKLTLDTPVSVIEEQTESLNHFYAENPQPQPAKNHVNIKIFYDTKFDVGSSILGIYDILGSRVDNIVTVTELNAMSSQISWNFNGLSSGVYFILINYIDHVEAVRIVVE